jgi:predicted GH43/DUF377 family glycosyl hydrolase
MAIVVTVLYDLAQLENEPRRRSVGEYLAFGRSLFRGNFDLHVFCDPSLVKQCEELLSERPDNCSTIIEALPFEELPAWNLGRQARIGVANGTISRTSSTANHIKDSIFATTIWWSKLGLLERVSKHPQYAEIQSLWWIDFGISHVSRRAVNEVFEVEQPLFATLGEIESIADDDWRFFEQGVPNVLGGMFAVPSTRISELREEFNSQLQRVLAMDLLVNDESLLSWIVSSSSCRTIETTFDQIVEDFLIEKTPAPIVKPRERESANESIVGMDEFVLRRIRLPDPERIDRRAMNPSIAAHPDGGFFCIVRHVNYEYLHGDYRQLDGGGVIRTDNVLLRLNEDLDVEWSSAIDDSMLCGHAELFPVLGLEDARLFLRGGDWWMSGTCREHRVDGRCQIVMCKIDIDSLHRARVDSSFQLPFLSSHGHEKNWMPVVGSEHEWVWGVRPTVRCRFDSLTNSLVPTRSAKGDLSIRGGSQAVPFREGWLAVVHDVEIKNEARVYRHRFVRWDTQWNLDFVSEPFRLGDDEFGLEFCAGLVVLDDDKRLVLSVGIGDSRAELIEMTIPNWL